MPEVEYDVDVELMELPHVFRTTLSTIPSEDPYLHVELAPLLLDETLKVGVCWGVGDWDDRRSVPFPLLARLVEIPGITWYIHQRGEGLAECDERLGIIQEFPGLFKEARAMRLLDLLISVDTVPAHLAGALAIPVWTLLQKHADWRWMEGRHDSPWYPTMCLFSQERCGEWGLSSRTLLQSWKNSERVDGLFILSRS